MSRHLRAVLTLGMLLLAAACSGSSSAATQPGTSGRSRGNLITAEEIRQRAQYSNLYDVIDHLRPRWLRTQGPDTMTGTPTSVQVHMDGNRLGGVDVLRSLAPTGVTSIQWLPPIDASARFGLDHSQGAIIISTGAGG